MATRSILITIVCLVLAGLPTIFIVSGDDYGISHDNPLGRFWALDEVLEGLGMTGSDRVVDEYGKVRTFPSHLMVRQYRDPTSHGLIDWVLVGAQLDGRVVMVGGAFSGAHVPGLLVPDEKVHAFLHELWMRSVGVEPVFYPDRDKDYDEEATDQGTSFIASWERKKQESSTLHLVLLRAR